MKIAEFIQTSLDHQKNIRGRILDGLTPQELAWQPGPESNSIGLIFFHMCRSEDNFIQGRILGKPQVWESEKWFTKFNMPVGECGDAASVEQIAAFKVPDIKNLLAYSDAVRIRTAAFLKGITPDELDKMINLPHFGNITIGSLLALTVVHLAEHNGEMSYIRGLKRGLNK